MDKIIVLDFGSQYSHLICRRIREFSVYAELVPFDISMEEIKQKNPKGIIFSGGQVGKDKKAGDIAKTMSEILGGAGGGNQRFAQGGGKDKSKKNDAIEKAKTMVLGV